MLVKIFTKLTIEHIDRSFNKLCDLLAKDTLKDYIANINTKFVTKLT